jgi:hypothetical protein
VTVDPSVAIVGIVALLIFGTTLASRALPQDIPKIIKHLTKWLGR